MIATPFCRGLYVYSQPHFEDYVNEQEIKMARRTRLSEAHQFFEGQDAETQNADTDTTSERV